MSLETIEVFKRVMNFKVMSKDLHKTPQSDWVQVDLEEWIDELDDDEALN